MGNELMEKLEALLKPVPAAERIYPRFVLEVSRDFWEPDWTYEEMGAIQKQLEEKYEGYLEQIKSVWGAPDYERTDDEIGWYCDAIRIACWQREGTTVLLALEHQDKELPFVLLLDSHTDAEMAKRMR